MLDAGIALLAALGTTLALGFTLGMAWEKTRRRLHVYPLAEGAARLAERRATENVENWRAMSSGSLRAGPNRRREVIS